MPSENDKHLTLGHSPDPDDAFMFYGLATDKIDTKGWRFTHVLQDIQTLNDRATRGELDITAISIHAYPYVADRYALTSCGASMGDGYGPMVVARNPMRDGHPDSGLHFASLGTVATPTVHRAALVQSQDSAHQRIDLVQLH